MPLHRKPGFEQLCVPRRRMLEDGLGSSLFREGSESTDSDREVDTLDVLNETKGKKGERTR